MAALWYTAAALIGALLAAGWWSDVRARRRVKSAPAFEVTPEQIRHVSLRQEDDR
jgi:hypothetical protein